jgi:hypothetical protein
MLEWDSNEFFYKMNETDVDGGILCFKALTLNGHLLKLDEQIGFVTEVEKNPISDNSNCWNLLLETWFRFCKIF